MGTAVQASEAQHPGQNDSLGQQLYWYSAAKLTSELGALFINVDCVIGSEDFLGCRYGFGNILVDTVCRRGCCC